MSEIEIKLEVDPGARAGVALAFAQAHATRLRLQAIYWDTPDGRLAAHGIALRVRREGRRWVQTVKAAGDSSLHRLEHNVALVVAGSPDAPAADPSRHADTPVGQRLIALLEGAPAIEPRYATDVLRRALRIAVDGAAVEVAFDEGVVRAGERHTPVCEVEVESLHGDLALLFDIARRGIAEHGLRIGSVSKSARGERLHQSVAHGLPVKAGAPALTTVMNLDAALRCTVATCVAQILANADEVAAGSPDPDHVHQLRVGLRRLRTALRELGSASPAVDPAWEPRLAHTFRELGVLRDHEVLAATVVPRLIDAGAPALAALVPVSQAREPRALVRDPAVQQTLVDLVEFSMGEPQSEAPAARKALNAILRGLHRKLARRAKRFESLPEAQQHAVRKLLKRLRYVAEFARSLHDPKKVLRYLDRLEPAQEALGRHNDEAMALALYRRAAEGGDANAWFAVGWLQGRQAAGAAQCARRLRQVADAPRFFD